MTYDKGSKIVGMIEDRLGEAGFIDFMHHIYSKYYFRIIRVADLQRELEEYTETSWDDFFKHWLYDKGMCDWAIEKVELHRESEKSRTTGFLEALHIAGNCEGRHHATIHLRQKAGGSTNPHRWVSLLMAASITRSACRSISPSRSSICRNTTRISQGARSSHRRQWISRVDQRR